MICSIPVPSVVRAVRLSFTSILRPRSIRLAMPLAFARSPPYLLRASLLLPSLLLRTVSLMNLQQHRLSPITWAAPIRGRVEVGGTTVCAPTGSDFFDAALPAQKNRPCRTPCTCTNCANGTNSKATNPDGSPRKKQHVCHYPNCSKVYVNASNLREHILVHKGERPFICHLLNCGKQFTRLDKLQRYFVTHTGEKRFVCVECGKRVVRRDSLNRHTKTHQKLREKEANSGSASGGGTNCKDSLPPLDNNPILSPPMPTPPTRAFPLEDNLFTDIPVN